MQSLGRYTGTVSYTHLDVYKRQALDSFSAGTPKVDHNGVYYLWAVDKAGNISAAAKVNVTALDIVPPVVVTVETQRTWDAEENWAKVMAQDDNSGVVAVSYTHLDVYKRQIPISSSSAAPERARRGIFVCPM